MVVNVKQLLDNIHEPKSKIWLHENGQDQCLHDFVDGAINMVASLRSCGLEFGESDVAKPFNLTKAG